MGYPDSVDGFLFLSLVFFFSALYDISTHCGKINRSISQIENNSLIRLIVTTATDKKTVKFKGTLWRTIYFYSFLFLSGFLGYANRFSFAKHLSKNTPYSRFTSSISIIRLIGRWRDLIQKSSLFLLNLLWIVNCIHYDLSFISFFQQPLVWLFKLTCVWLDLLWSLSVELYLNYHL